MTLTDRETAYLSAARVARLGTADADGRPHVVPICFALAGDALVTPLDEKPKRAAPGELRRVRDIEANPRVAVVVDHYTESWGDLGWLQLRGTAAVRPPGHPGHTDAVEALCAKYSQYAGHDLGSRPVIEVEVARAVSWGVLDPNAA